MAPRCRGAVQSWSGGVESNDRRPSAPAGRRSHSGLRARASGVASGVLVREKQPLREQPSMELFAVIVGAVLGYGAGWAQQRLDRRRRRIGLASAMLLELRRVERNLREIAASDR